MGGLPGARLLNRLGMPGSDDLVLRRIKAKAAKEERKVRVLGVDDWAWSKGLLNCQKCNDGFPHGRREILYVPRSTFLQRENRSCGFCPENRTAYAG
jgi:hypothetical protein